MTIRDAFACCIMAWKIAGYDFMSMTASSAKTSWDQETKIIHLLKLLIGVHFLCSQDCFHGTDRQAQEFLST